MAKTVAELSEIVADLKARLEKLEKLNNGSDEFTNHLRFVDAYRRFMTEPGFEGYKDSWVEACFDGRMEALRKADDTTSGFDDDGFQGGLA